MEAFILADKVLTMHCMDNYQHQYPKYLRKYDINSRHSYFPKKHANNVEKKPHRREETPTSVKVKNLLSSLAEGVEQRFSSEKTKNEKFDHYFAGLSDSKNIADNRKGKIGLLIRKIDPHSQQYDANFDAVCKRSPRWGFSPHDRQLSQVTKRCSAAQNKKAKTSKPYPYNSPKSYQGSTSHPGESD